MKVPNRSGVETTSTSAAQRILAFKTQQPLTDDQGILLLNLGYCKQLKAMGETSPTFSKSFANQADLTLTNRDLARNERYPSGAYVSLCL